MMNHLYIYDRKKEASYALVLYAIYKNIDGVTVYVTEFWDLRLMNWFHEEPTPVTSPYE